MLVASAGLTAAANSAGLVTAAASKKIGRLKSPNGVYKVSVMVFSSPGCGAHTVDIDVCDAGTEARLIDYRPGGKLAGATGNQKVLVVNAKDIDVSAEKPKDVVRGA